MRIDISSPSRMHDFDLETKALGQVHCGSLNDKMSSNLTKTLMMSDVVGLNFARKVLSLVGKKTMTGDGQEDAQVRKEEGFTDEEISKITDAEVEIFAREFIAHNRWLLHSYMDGERQVRSNEVEGVSHTPITIDLPKGDAEGSTNYLVRLYRHYFSVRSERLKKQTKTGTAKAMQQLAHGTLAETNRYLIENSATAVMERIMKHDQDRMRVIDPFKDARRYIEENAVSVAKAMHFEREQELFEIEKRYLAEISASTMLAKEIYRNEALIRETALGQAQRETMSSVIVAEMEKQQQEFRDLLKSHEAMFRLPQAFEATHLLESYQVGAVSEFAQRHANDIFLDRQRSLEAITTPWLHREDAARSVTAILELQCMGNALRTMKGFDPEFTTSLRLDLGDWRDKITFPKSVFIDPVARTDFYVNRGFNTALTDFPDAAFHQGLGIAGLDGVSLDLELHGSAALPSTDPKEETDLQRTNRCHDRLQRFERRLRQFIDEKMTSRYGPNWPKKRLASELYEKWEFKKERAERNGGMLTFIEVADFTDYETIICRKDHWREIFETMFKKKESVRESLQRLQPIRLAVTHARIVTKEDELYLVAEIRRLLSAIK
ncbi:MAG: Swt1 family HEPN domain-containing protein [Deltaproteobacteria bacterium]|nr:Swt1 family HEPN domain-containing protein [Deltaproteobacteria bacterium]